MPINVDGQEYDSWDQLPREVRARLAALPDKNGDGIPDVLQGDLSGLGTIGQGGDPTVVSTTSVSVNGVPYRSLADLPAVLRGEVDAALAQLGALGEAAARATAVPEPPTVGSPPSKYAAPGIVSSGAAGSGAGRPMMINGEPYDPEATRKRWWQFWR